MSPTLQNTRAQLSAAPTRNSEMTSSTTCNLITMLGLVLAAALLAGCGASARTWAAADCWKSTEKTSAKMDIDKRADIVNKCIDEKMR
jgi:hypothetical protein